jgi:hypothetical protein
MILLLLASFAGPARGVAQNPAQIRTTLSSLPCVIITLREDLPEHSAATSPFSSFEVIDDRPDTARIGIHTFIPTFGKAHNRQLIFGSSASTQLEAWLNKHFARPGAPYTAFIILRNLWLSDASFLPEERMADPGKLYQRTHIRLKAEIYACRDSQYMPVIRFDTLQSYVRSNPYTSLSSYYSIWGKDLTTLLTEMTDTASRVCATRSGHARLISLGDILRFNRSRFDAPIAANEPLIPGVYADFEEFRNNAPSIRNFEIKEEKSYRLLYIKADGASCYCHDAWGYCDGKNIFVMRDGILCHTWKEGKAFYLHKTLSIFAVDMDSGRVY